jgi:superfamily I DNA/RNA helicase
MADYYFNFPPITSLTLPQRAALNEPNPIALSGGPGTGKSFVSLWRHISNHIRQNPIKSQLLTFTTSLAYYLKASSASQNDSAAQMVDSTTSWFYQRAENRDEIIIDEAQDMPKIFYQKEIQSDRDIRDYSHKISYGADNQQVLYPNKSTIVKELRIIFAQNIPFVLDKNFRNTKQILQFAKVAFPEAFIPQMKWILV